MRIGMLNSISESFLTINVSKFFRLCFLILITFVLQHSSFGQVIINEILTNNQGSITNFLDEDGDSPDYIELHNNSNISVNISEWKLKDSDNIWTFPSNTIIPSNGYLTIWASSKDRYGPNLHTNFSLSSKGEYLGLYDDNDNIISAYAPAYPEQFTGMSYGYNNTGELRYFNIASPGVSNGSSFLGKLSLPEAMHGRGFYNDAFYEKFIVSESQTEIRYTIDGTVPSLSSNLYSDSILINASSTGIFTLRLKSFKNGFQPSDDISYSYIFPNALYTGLAADGLSSLPIFSINTDDQEYPDENNKKRHIIEFIETDPSKNGFSITAGIKEFGESSVDFYKSNFRIFFESVYGHSDLHYDLFDGYGQAHLNPTKVFDKIELRGGSWDSWQAAAGGQFSPSDFYLTDRYIKDTRLDMGSKVPHGRFVNVFVNGDYRGFYQLRERYDHVFHSSYAVDDEKPETFEAIKINDGSYSNNGDLNINGDGSVFLNLGNSYQNDKEWVDMETYIDFSISLSLMESDFEKEYRGVGSMIPGSPNKYQFIYNDNDFRLRPVDNVLGHEIGYSPGYFVPNSLSLFSTYKNDPEFVQAVLERTAIHFCPGGALSIDSMMSRLYYWENEILLPMHAEDVRYDGYQSINYYGSNYVEDKFGSWSSNMNELKTRIPNLTPDLYSAWTNEGLFQGCDIRPQILDREDQISQINSTVSYTLDVVDPDGDNMNFSSSSLPPGLILNANTGEISGTPSQVGEFNVTVKITDTNGKWINHTFKWTVVDWGYVKGANLVINEIHYNPLDSALSNGGLIDDDNFEFIELKNIGDVDANLVGKVFTKGISLDLEDVITIAPDSFVVFANDANWFNEKYGFYPDGEYQGKLNNNGEYLRLKGPYKEVLDSLVYDDENGWSSDADNTGFSIALKLNLGNDNHLPTNWDVQKSFVTPRKENYFCDAYVINNLAYNLSCHNANDGLIQISAIGGQAPYSFNWSNGETGSSINNLSAGDYFLTVTDALGCEENTTVNITEPDAIVLDFTISDESSYNANDGSASVTVNNGVGPFSYLWSNGSTSQSINNLTPDTYYISVTDSNNCIIDDSITIEAIECNTLSLIGSHTNLSYFNANDGSASVSVSGAIGVINYLWSNGATTSSIQNLTPGTYSVTVSDDLACTDSTSFTIENVDCSSFLINLSTVNQSYFGLNNGEASIGATGGAAPYTYAWSTGATTSNITDLAPSSYSVTVVDNLGCELNENFTIDPIDCSALSLNIIGSDISALGANDGSAQAIAASGTAPYSYVWSTGDQSDQISGLSPGNYSVTVTDHVACSMQSTIIINDVDCASLSVNVQAENESQYLANDGEAIANGTGGEFPYNYLWSTGATGNVIQNLAPGNYSVTITDNNNCSASQGFAIFEAQSSYIKGKIYYDLDQNGSFDGNDLGLENIDVRISESNGNTLTVYTDLDGNWISMVRPGLSMIEIIDNNNLLQGGVPIEGNDPTLVTAILGDTISGGNDGFSFVSEVCGILYFDENNNGTNDNNDFPIPNISIDITDANGQLYSLITDNNGQYCATMNHGMASIEIDIQDSNFPNGAFFTEGSNISTSNISNGNIQFSDIGIYREITINIKLFLEGALLVGTGENLFNDEMRTELNDLQLLPGQTYIGGLFGNIYNPPGQPFSSSPWFYYGTEGDQFDSGGDANLGDAGYPSDVVDWVLLSLRSGIDNNTELCKSAVLLQKNGELILVDAFNCDNSLLNSFHIVAEHRNHLIVMTQNPISVQNGSLDFDFTTNQSYQDNFGLGIAQKNINSITGQNYYVLSGGNGDQLSSNAAITDINVNDKITWESTNNNFSVYSLGDFDISGDINVNDKILWEGNNNNFSSVPR